MRKIILVLCLVLILVGFGYLLNQFKPNNNSEALANFNKLSPDDMQKLIVEQRDYAILQAQERGEYKCCISPACTMCYMEANQWNYFSAGKCFCDDFIAQGKKACPQCEKALSCEVKAN